MSENAFPAPPPRSRLENISEWALGQYRDATSDLPWEFRMASLAVAALALGFLTVADAVHHHDQHRPAS